MAAVHGAAVGRGGASRWRSLRRFASPPDALFGSVRHPRGPLSSTSASLRDLLPPQRRLRAARELMQLTGRHFDAQEALR